MTAKIIDGKQIANETILEIKETISKATMKGEKPPGLAVIQVGEDSASKIYKMTLLRISSAINKIKKLIFIQFQVCHHTLLLNK